MTKQLYIKSYGCQMNVYDSDRMKDVLAPLGYCVTDSQDDADLIILNTCHIREKAADKVYSELGRLRDRKEERASEGREMLIAVAGCVAQAEGEEVMRRAPYVDMVFGPQSYHQLPEMLARCHSRFRGNDKVMALDFSPVEKFDRLPEEVQTNGASAFVSVQEGCDKFCTFCVVPYTRGAEYSRPVADVLREVKRHLAQGAMEITLLGQNVNAYHGEGLDGSTWSLGRLARELAALDGMARIRYTTSHPRDMDEELIATHRDIPAMMPWLHLPIQSGSDRILKAMNRKHKASEYLAIIDKLRTARPDIAFSSDFIVGFPGETEDDFEATLRLVEMVGYASSYSFKYSPRPGTPAAGSQEQISEEVKTERLARLQSLLQSQHLRFNQSSVGKIMPVLLERDGKFENQLIGKTPYMQSVHISDASQWRNQLIDVTIIAAHANSLTGKVLESAQAA